MEAAVTYLSLIAMVASLRERHSTYVAIWIVLTSLLKRPHNLVLTWMHLLQYSLIRPHLVAQLQPFFYDLAHYWIGMTWYFQDVSLQLSENTICVFTFIEFRETGIIWPGSILLLAM